MAPLLQCEGRDTAILNHTHWFENRVPDAVDREEDDGRLKFKLDLGTRAGVNKFYTAPPSDPLAEHVRLTTCIPNGTLWTVSKIFVCKGQCPGTRGFTWISVRLDPSAIAAVAEELQVKGVTEWWTNYHKLPFDRPGPGKWSHPYNERPAPGRCGPWGAWNLVRDAIEGAGAAVADTDE